MDMKQLILEALTQQGKTIYWLAHAVKSVHHKTVMKYLYGDSNRQISAGAIGEMLDLLGVQLQVELSPAQVVGICRVCGCTDDKACHGNCSWVDDDHTLCSRCDEKEKKT